MRILAIVRTFIANYVIPGWGFWFVGERKLGYGTAIALGAIVVIFSWTRLILNPIGFVALAVSLVGLVFWSACHSAFIEFRRYDQNSPPRNWKAAFTFAVSYFVLIWMLFSNRDVILGYETFRLPARSMAPTILAGDYIVVDTWHYSSTDPMSGDIVIFEVPHSEGVNYIKRVVGLPGDDLSMSAEELFRNGLPVDEPYALYDDGPVSPSSSFLEISVPPDQYFVLGDNRNRSRDSRYLGMIPRENIIGRAVHIWYSYDRTDGTQWHRFPSKLD